MGNAQTLRDYLGLASHGTETDAELWRLAHEALSDLAVLDLESVREVFVPSDKWDGDESEQSIILRFLAHYSKVDREYDENRAQAIADELGKHTDLILWADRDSNDGTRGDRIDTGGLQCSCREWTAPRDQEHGTRPYKAWRLHMAERVLAVLRGEG